MITDNFKATRIPFVLVFGGTDITKLYVCMCSFHNNSVSVFFPGTAGTAYSLRVSEVVFGCVCVCVC